MIALSYATMDTNIRARGTVTALRQEDRPQQINTIIGGRVEKWYVKEGDL
jgi:multidrug efflux pump subunit AcrA (membrane-fusion protein)